MSSCITLLQSNSDRFCGIRLCDSSGLSYLLVSVYMPTYYDPSCVNVYLNVLGELSLPLRGVTSISLLVISMWTLIVVVSLLNC